LEPFFERDSWRAVAFLQALREHYGALPQEVLGDGADWWAIALSHFGIVRVVMARGLRNAIEGFFGEFLKRRIKDFDRYFPTWDRELGSVKRWLRVFAWWHNATRWGSLPQLI
jgi:transposase-like protein